MRRNAGAEIRIHVVSRWETARSDESGAFRLSRLAFGNYQVFLRAPGFVNMQAARVGVKHGEETTGVVFTMHPGAEIRGRVLDRYGPVERLQRYLRR